MLQLLLLLVGLDHLRLGSADVEVSLDEQWPVAVRLLLMERKL